MSLKFLPLRLRVPLVLAAAMTAVVGGLAGAGESTPLPAGTDQRLRQQPVAAGFEAMPATCGIALFEARLVNLVNRMRAVGANCGAAGTFGPAEPLRWNQRLADVARSHTAEMAATDRFQHASLRDGRSVAERLHSSGNWGEYGENIGAGGLGPEEVLARWHRSPRHCANLMNPGFTDLGAACFPARQPSRYLTYWTMDLAGP